MKVVNENPIRFTALYKHSDVLNIIYTRLRSFFSLNALQSTPLHTTEIQFFPLINHKNFFLSFKFLKGMFYQTTNTGYFKDNNSPQETNVSDITRITFFPLKEQVNAMEFFC